MSRNPLALIAVLVAGCPSEDPPPTEPMDMAADYALAAQQLDSECVGGDWDYWEVFDFMERTPSDVPSMQLAVTQTGGNLVALQQPTGCELTGTVGPTGTFSLRGPCDTASMDRDLQISGNVSAFGATLDMDATMSIDVDADDGAGGGPDGTIDCVVGTVELSGSGA